MTEHISSEREERREMQEENLLSGEISLHERGLQLLGLKSDIFEPFFKKASKGEIIRCNWRPDGGPVDCWFAPMFFPNASIHRNRNELLIDVESGWLEAGFLTVVGLSQGVDLVLPGVYNLVMRTAFENRLNEVVREIYSHYIQRDQTKVRLKWTIHKAA